MTTRFVMLAVTSALLLASCRPRPLDISVPQQERALVISSTCADGKRVFVGATWSLSALQQLMDTTALNVQPEIPKELLVDSALVTITSEAGVKDTLSLARPGLFVTNRLSLNAGASYRLEVHDYRSSSKAIATTVFLPAPLLSDMQPRHEINDGDTQTVLSLALDEVQPGTYFAVSYATPESIRKRQRPLPRKLEALHLFQPKQLALFRADISTKGRMTKDITLQVKATDTVMVQVVQVSAEYFQYLSTYKRAGSLINQLTGEPINLPSNSSSGLGFFTLYQPLVAVYDLKTYSSSEVSN